MRRFLRYFLTILSVAVAPALVCACGSTIAENAALADKPLQGPNARLKIYREDEVGALGGSARVKIDGREVANLGGGGSIFLDVPAGQHDIAVDNWQHPNVYTMKLDAKPNMMYALEVSVRAEAVVAGAFGLVGTLAEAAANENGGTYQIRIVEAKPVKK